MLSIISSSDSRSIAALLNRQPSQDPLVRRRVAAIVAAVRRAATARCVGTRGGSTASTARSRSRAEEMRGGGAARCPPTCGGRS